MVSDFKELAGDMDEFELTKSLPGDITKKLDESNSRFGKYIRLEMLGRGGSGTVWKAFDTTLKRHVALKLIHTKDSTDIERFKKEAEIIASLEHPNIVPVHETGCINGQHYMAIKYIEGPSLEEVSKEIETEELMRVMMKVCDALSYAHTKGIIHRDIKPQNILIDMDRNVYVVDFGIAKQEGTNLTRQKEIIGTPHFMAPEQIEGRHVGTQSDIYSLGTTMYYCLTGALPFESGSDIGTILDILEKDIIPPRKLNRRIPVDVEAIIMKATSREMTYRYKSMDEMKDDIKRYLNNEPVKAGKNALLYLPGKIIRKNKISLSICLLVLLMACAIILLYNNYSKRIRAEKYIELSNLLFAEKRYEEASKYAESALELRPGNIFAISILVKTYTILGSYQRLESLCEKSLKYHPDNITFINSLASAKVQLKKSDEVIGLYDKIADKNTMTYYSYSVLADSYLILGQKEKAIEHLRYGLMLKPDDIDMLTDLGLALAQSGKYDEAERTLKKILEIDENNTPAIERLAYTYIQKKDYGRAVTLLEKARELKPDDLNIYRRLARSYLEQRQMQKAIETMEAAIERGLQPDEAYVMIAYCNIEQGKYDEAIRQLEYSLELNPGNSGAYYTLGKAYYMKKDLMNALYYTELARDMAPDKADIYILLGNINFSNSANADAYENFKKALELEPKNSYALEGYVKTLAIMGEAGKAWEIYEETKALNPQLAETLRKTIIQNSNK